MAELNWKEKACKEIACDAAFALNMCKATAENENIELYWVVEQFIRAFCDLAKRDGATPVE